MTRTQTVTVTTTRTSNQVPRRNLDQRTIQHASNKTRSKVSNHNDKLMSSRYAVQQEGENVTKGTRSVAQATARQHDTRARRKSSDGSSSNPTGSSFSDDESSRGIHSAKPAKQDGALDSTRTRSVGSDVSHDSVLERIIRAIPGCFPKSPRRRQTPRITISKSSTGFEASRRKRQATKKRVLTGQSQTLNNTTTSNSSQSSLSNGIRKASSGQNARLSPRSLRRARLMVLDKRSRSSSDISIQLEYDRRGSKLLPRQHYCEPNISGHNSVPNHRRSIAETSKKHSSGSPNPDSPGGNDGSTPLAHGQPKRSCEPRSRVVNMRVADMLCLATEESYNIEIVPTSILRKLPLDEATRAQIAAIITQKCGSTLVGIGPWAEFVSQGEDSIWNNWCCLSRSLPVDGDEPLLGLLDRQPSHVQRVQQNLLGEVVLVPLTNAQAELLRHALRGPNSEVERKNE